MPSFLIKDDGSIYVSTPVLAARKDMRPFEGTLEEARKEAGKSRDERFPDPVVLTPKEPVPVAVVSDESRMGTIKAAIEALDPENPEHFTKKGSPRVQAIEAELGDDITMEERDQAIAEMQAE